MAKITKFLFTGLGWAILGPIGGLLGYLLGNAISSNNQIDSDAGTSPHRGPYRDTGTQQDINVALMVLIAAVMKADGSVKRSELNLVKHFLRSNYGEEQGKEMLQVIRKLIDEDIELDRVCAQIKVNTTYDTRYHMVDFLFGIGGADGDFHVSELAILKRIAQYLGLSRSDIVSMQERHVGTTWRQSDYGYREQRGRTYPSSENYATDPYHVLGIDSSATDEEVKKAYRRMAKKYHPDRVAGMSEEMQRNAAQQMKEVNLAYDAIKSRRASLK